MLGVSVIIPVFNRAGSLPKAVESVLDQTYRGLEVVIADDMSDDDTPQVAARLAGRDVRVRYHRLNAHRGAQAARNAGIHAATGQWVAFLDSDDQWLRDSLEMRLRVATERRVQVVHSACSVINPGKAEPEPFP